MNTKTLKRAPFCCTLCLYLLFSPSLLFITIAIAIIRIVAPPNHLPTPLTPTSTSVSIVFPIAFYIQTAVVKTRRNAYGNSAGRVSVMAHQGVISEKTVGFCAN